MGIDCDVVATGNELIKYWSSKTQPFQYRHVLVFNLCSRKVKQYLKDSIRDHKMVMDAINYI